MSGLIYTMRNERHPFERISNSAIFLLIASIILIKIIVSILIKNNILNISLGGGSDANYYNSYAEGSINVAVNIWPVILRHLNDVGLYSRDVITYLLIFLNMLVIPVLATRLSGLKLSNYQKYYFYSFLIYLAYPTIYFYSLDVFRDVFMVFIFLLGCVVAKKSMHSNNPLSFMIYFSISILVGFFLLALRPYLGYAFLISLFLWKIKFTKKRIVFLAILYFLALFVLNYIGALDALTEYRSGFEEASGGSTLGLNFSNPVLFIPNFILSTLGQLFGLYITNPLAVILLLIETLPFFFMLLYVLKEIKLADSFVRFLIIFFVLYGSVWLIGNDNLGTALRLRIYNYLAIYISFFYILRLKKLYSATSEVVSK